MKILTNKGFKNEIKKATEPLKEEINQLNEKINKKEYNYLVERDDLLKVNQEHQKLLEQYLTEIEMLKKKVRVINGNKGALSKELKKIKKELEVKND